MNALNSAYDVPEARRWWKRYLFSFALTVVSGSGGVATVLVVVGPRTARVPERWARDRACRTQWLAQVPVALLLVTCARPVPRGAERAPAAAGGGAPERLGVVLWACVSLGFQLYVANFGRFGVTYGSVGGVMILLAYLYLGPFCCWARSSTPSSSARSRVPATRSCRRYPRQTPLSSRRGGAGSCGRGAGPPCASGPATAAEATEAPMAEQIARVQFQVPS